MRSSPVTMSRRKAKQRKFLGRANDLEVDGGVTRVDRRRSKR